MKRCKDALRFTLWLLPVALIAGPFVGMYQLDALPSSALEEVIAQVGSTTPLILIGALQTVGYALFCGFFGYILADTVGLWKPFKLQKRPLWLSLLLSLIGGILLAADHWVFGSVIDGIQEANAAMLTFHGIAAAILYGGVMEEVMLRLFVLSLLAWLIWKLFCRKQPECPVWAVILANIAAALLFAAGHLPATVMLFGTLTPLILLRCFLLNGGFGLFLGRLYRKYGIIYAMLCHAGIHIVSKLILLIAL